MELYFIIDFTLRWNFKGFFQCLKMIFRKSDSKKKFHGIHNDLKII